MADRVPTPGATRILVVEDEPSISDVVATALRYQGHSVTQVDDGVTGLALAEKESFGLIVLDVMLPGLDGYELCRRLREAGRFSPVLFLTARDDAADRIRGFVTGGDDYLTKPFAVDELVLRVSAILRRTNPVAETDCLRVADLSLEPRGREVRRDGIMIDLSATEFRLLHYLMTNKGAVLSKSQILNNVWDYAYEGGDNVVELYIGYLRRKIDDGRTPLIHTRRGMGYVLRET
ncbi:MAG: response regulator transcription factor [Nocardioides sp.]